MSENPVHQLADLLRRSGEEVPESFGALAAYCDEPVKICAFDESLPVPEISMLLVDGKELKNYEKKIFTENGRTFIVVELPRESVTGQPPDQRYNDEPRCDLKVASGVLPEPIS